MDYLVPRYEVPDHVEAPGGVRHGSSCRRCASPTVTPPSEQRIVIRHSNRAESMISLTGTLAVRRHSQYDGEIPWSSSVTETLLFLVMSVLSLALMVGVTCVSVITSECLIFQLKTPSQCDFDTASLPYGMAIILANNAVCIAMVTISSVILLVCSRKQDNQLYFAVLPTRQICSHLVMRRKFWILLLLLAVTVTSLFYISFKIHKHQDVNATATPQGKKWKTFNFLFAVDQIFLVVLMCLLNYSRPARRSAHLTIWGFRFLLASLSYYQLHHFISTSFILSFKILPSARYHGLGDKAPVDPAGALMTSGHAAFRASTSWFLFTKMFKPHKDLLRPVYDEMPREGDE